jgi:hypothetical protein
MNFVPKKASLLLSPKIRVENTNKQRRFMLMLKLFNGMCDCSLFERDTYEPGIRTEARVCHIKASKDCIAAYKFFLPQLCAFQALKKTQSKRK